MAQVYKKKHVTNKHRCFEGLSFINSVTNQRALIQFQNGASICTLPKPLLLCHFYMGAIRLKIRKQCWITTQRAYYIEPPIDILRLTTSQQKISIRQAHMFASHIEQMRINVEMLFFSLKKTFKKNGMLWINCSDSTHNRSLQDCHSY